MYVACFAFQVCSGRIEEECFVLWRLFANVITCNYVVDSKKKPEISYPTQFEHTIHVGFDPVTSEFTVSHDLKSLKLNFTHRITSQFKTKSICQLPSLRVFIWCFETLSLAIVSDITNHLNSQTYDVSRRQ